MVSLLHLEEIKKVLQISGVSVEACSWSCKEDEDKAISGHQIDLLLVRKDQVINICEMKYAAYPYEITKQEEFDWQKRVDDFIKVTGTKYSIRLTLITPFGIKNNTHSYLINDVITLEDLMK